jgi:hypothetical protein
MKLVEYIEEFGIRKSWFAAKLGMSAPFFSDCLAGRRKFPRKHWKRIVELTKKKVKIEDLFDGEEGYGKKT